MDINKSATKDFHVPRAILIGRGAFHPFTPILLAERLEFAAICDLENARVHKVTGFEAKLSETTVICLLNGRDDTLLRHLE